MACLSEFQCAVYADGEVPAYEAREIAEHLEICGACRGLLAALRGETRALVECLQSTDFIEFELEDEILSQPQAHRLGVMRFTAFVLAMSVLLRPVLDFVEELGLGGGMNWLAIAAAHVVPAGIDFVGSIWTNANWIALSAIVFLAAVLFSRKSVLTNSILSIVALLTVFSPSSYGLDVRAEESVTVPAGETIDDTLIVAGASATIDGTVTGDLIALVRDITIRGTVMGNVISFARRVELEGRVDGSIIGFAQSLQNRGEVAHNMYAFAQTVDIAPDAGVAENAVIFASDCGIEGSIGKDAQAWAASVNVSDAANIGGDLTARVSRSDNVRIAPGATIGGATNIRTPGPRPSRYTTLSFYIWQTIWLAAAFLAGLVLFWIFPRLSQVDFGTMRELLISAAIGFLTLVAVPAAAIIAAITVVGLPLGLIVLACWTMAVYAAKIVVAGFLGRSLLRNNVGPQPATALALLAGLVLIFVAINLPYIGALVNLLITLFGLGAIAIGVYQMPRWRSAQG